MQISGVWLPDARLREPLQEPDWGGADEPLWQLAAFDPPPADGGRAQWPERYAELRRTTDEADAFFGAMGRDGWDGHGAQLPVGVWDAFANASSIYVPATGQSVLLVGKINGRWLTDEQDVITHEYTHSVISEEINDGAGAGTPTTWEFDAVNEAIADVMAGVMTKDWDIGGFRDVSVDASGRGSSVDPIATDLRILRRQQAEEDALPLAEQGRIQIPATEPHYASGIVSNAAADVQEQVGWERTGQIFYDVIHDPTFTGQTGFEDVAKLAESAARDRYGDGTADAVAGAFARNGVATPGAQLPPLDRPTSQRHASTAPPAPDGGGGLLEVLGGILDGLRGG